MPKFPITEDVHSVYVQDCAGMGLNLYFVMVNGKRYDMLTSDERLTHAQQVDIANGYREALEGYRSP